MFTPVRVRPQISPVKVLFTRFAEVKIDPVQAWWSTEAHRVGAPNVAEVENDAVVHPMYRD